MKFLLNKVAALILCVIIVIGVLPASIYANGIPGAAPNTYGIIAGDINEDQSVNNKDLIRLFMYLSGYNVSVNEYALNVNGDYSVNNKDITRLFKYLSGWDVDIYPVITDCIHSQTVIKNSKTATCTEAGYSGDTYCDNEKCRIRTNIGSVTPKASHSEELRGYKAATCTEAGYSGDIYCADCGIFISSGSVLPASGHTGGEANYHSKAVCEVCNQEYGDYSDIRAYDQLNENQKLIYTAIDGAVGRLEMDFFDVSFVPGTAENVMVSDARIALYAVECDRPEYFWMPRSISCKSIPYPKTNIVKEFSISFSFECEDPDRGLYNVTAEEKAAMQAELDTKIEEILSGARDLSDNFQKERYIHDYLCSNITYDWATALASSGFTPPDGEDLGPGDEDWKAVDYATIDPDTGELYYYNDPWSYTIYGALINGRCVCEGYSRAMELLMNRLGIPCNIITGYGQGGPHMWNIINPGDGLYYIDVTFDDPYFVEKYRNDSDANLDLPGLHLYFNITEEQLKEDHILDDIYPNGIDYSDFTIPVALNFFQTFEEKTEYYYYTKVGAYIYENDASDAAQFAISEYNNNHADGEYKYNSAISLDEAWELLATELKGNMGVYPLIYFGNNILFRFVKIN